MTPQELEQLCAYLAEDYELAGYEDVSVAVYQGAAGRYIKSASKTYETDGTPCYTVGLVAIRSGCWVNMSLFTYFDAPSGEMNARLLKMADSLRMTLPDGLTELSAHGVTLRLSLPDGLSLQADTAMLAGLVPEKPAGEVIGVAAAEDGSWYVQWQLIEGARGDMERVSGSGLRSLYEDRANRKKGMGFTVTAMSAVTDLRQRYIRLSYEMPQEGSESWFAEEYYTKQGGWGVVITAYSCGQPLTEEASAAFLEVIAAQLITVKAE